MTPKRRIIPVFIPHYGCGNSCVYCDQKLISGAGTPATAKDVVDAIRNAGFGRCVSTPAELALYGGSFTAIPVDTQNELLEAARPFLQSGELSSIRVSTRPDCIDSPTVERLKNFGVKTIELGAQSMCDDVLEKSLRGHTSEDIVRSSGVIKNAGLDLVLQMMTGLPGDDAEKSRITAKRLIDLAPDGVRIYPTVVIRGTVLHEMLIRGEYLEHSLDDAVRLCARLYPMFDDAMIPVIRMGLNPNEALSAGDAVAGAYHPAFGELVYSRIYYEKALAVLSDIPAGSDAVLAVAAGRVSMMTGNKKSNINALKARFSLRSIRVVESNIAKWEVLRVE